MKINITACLAIWLAPFVYGDQAGDRARLNGTWRLENDGPKNSETWVIERRPETLRLAYSHDDAKIIDFECNSMARECNVKEEDGKKAKISLWFNGPKLVQLETKGSDVVKRRFVVTDDGDTMELEVIPIVPDGKPKIARFKRVQDSLARQH